MKTNKIKQTVEDIKALDYNVTAYNIKSNKVGHIMINGNNITGTVIKIIQENFQIHGINYICKSFYIVIEEIN